MYKTLKVIQIVIWSVVALVLIGLLIGFTSNDGMAWLKSLREPTGPIELMKEDIASVLDETERIVIDCDAANIIILTQDEQKVSMSHYAANDTDEDKLATITSTPKEIRITQESKNNAFTLGNWNFGGFNVKSWNARIEVAIPADYTGELSIETIAGDVELTQSFVLSDLSVTQKFGNFTAQDITVQRADFSNVAGDVYIEDFQADFYDFATVSGDFSAHSLIGDGSMKLTSGDVDISTVEGALNFNAVSSTVNINSMTGEGKIKLISGDVDLMNLTLTGTMDFSSVSGDIELILDKTTGAQIDVDTTSGDIRSIYDISISSNDKSASGSIGLAQYLLRANTTSGSVHID